MCITNDDALRNGNKRNNVMRKKMLEKKRKIYKKGNYEEVVTIKGKKETKDEKK